MDKLYYVKWHDGAIWNVKYWICSANSESERNMKFDKFCEENNIHLGAYSPRVIEIPENGVILTPN